MAKVQFTTFKGRLFLVFLVLLVFVGYEFISHSSEKQTKDASVSGLSHSVMGVSILYEWMNALHADSGKLFQRAYLKSSDLESSGTIAILSPRARISEREAGLLQSFVQKGGKLIVSFHDDASLLNLSLLLKRLEMNLSVEETTHFTNGAPTLVAALENDLFFRNGEQYAFYSINILNNADCSRDRLSCYFTKKQVGSGYVVLLAGLPFFSNGLIGQANNSDAALRIMDWAKTISFDEYHHFFSDRSVLDLIANPSFSLPLLGMALLLVLFFLFAHTKFHRRHLEEQATTPGHSVHEWNEGVVSASLTAFARQNALTFHHSHLVKIFQRVKNAPVISKPNISDNSEAEMIREASTLIFLHKKLLLQKRRI
ncbi:MAG: DUF4350 domain-containing protein [Deltaproteobacteria bacterium]|nr:DUF4350 domain-containing protein [Deltaproteobacteria bacterium]